MKKILRDWGIPLALVLALYFSGLHTEVIGRLQGLFLSAGLMKPNVENQEPTPAGTASENLAMKLISLGGESYLPEDYTNRVVFVNFWATWCPPCIAEMPSIHQMHEEMSPEGVQFLMIAVSDQKEKVKDFMSRKEYRFQPYMLTGQLPHAFGSDVIPATFVLNKKGEVVFRHEGMSDYNTAEFKAFLRKLLDES